jgi:CheY-like chemotaxis protein
LADEPIVRLILDGTEVWVRLDHKATAISLLVVIGVRADGQKVLLAIKSMGGESTEAWRAVLDDLIQRGLRRPEFLIVDGAPGLEAAGAAVWDGVSVQRVHKHRNLLAHAPERLHEEITADYNDMIYAATREEVEARRDLGRPDPDCGRPAGRAPTGRTRDIPIIGMSAHALESEREQAIATRCDELDAKPIEFDSLVATIRRVLAQPKSLGLIKRGPAQALIALGQHRISMVTMGPYRIAEASFAPGAEGEMLKCALCGRRLEPNAAWKGRERYYCNGFCAEAEQADWPAPARSEAPANDRERA